jgi:urea transport system ATP-binding protein
MEQGYRHIPIQAETHLTIDHLSVSYEGSRILRNIDLVIGRGKITAVMGRNGMGKTTLLKAIVGLLEPDEGTITLDETDITEMAPDVRARMGLGYVPQGREIFPRLTVEENLRIGMEAREEEDEELADSMVFDLFPVLSQMKDRLGGNLSGGQQQQLAIARALVGNPRILILDEPTEGIQPSIILEIEKVLQKLKEETDLTIILVEQYFEFARKVADHISLIERGSVALQGAADELSDDAIKSYLTF